jgi:acyl carrier protein
MVDPQAVLQVVADSIGLAVAEIRPDFRLVDDLDMDSIDLEELWLDLGEAFDRVLPIDLPDLKTVQDIIDWLSYNG